MNLRLMDLAKSAYQAAIVHGFAPGRRATPFVIASGPRSGSTLVQSLLNSHPNAVCMHEILLETAGTPRFYRYNLGRRKQLIDLRSRDLKGFLDAVLLEPQPPWVNAVGFKAHVVQPNDKNLRRKAWEFLGQVPDLRVIWLTRNPVRSVISFAIARKTGAWIGGKSERPVELDPAYILRRLELEEREAEEARSRIDGLAVFETSFEEIVVRPDEVLSDVQAFLGLPRRALRTTLKRQNPRPISELVSNFDSIEAGMRGTRWYSYLVDEEAVAREV